MIATLGMFFGKQATYLDTLSSTGKESQKVWAARQQYMHTRNWGTKENILTAEGCVTIAKISEMVAYTEFLFTAVSQKFLRCSYISDGNRSSL